ncbi:solute carrier family 41 member 1-like isoform X3 [Eucyclogobius newberryi]|uniref:solute carrier family 41 member 1-like isoform X3 n=1 Tax=Eucyclogobius newberryi TaxID=166745 RepID=UPI003B59742A
MVVIHLLLERCCQGRKLRGVRCEVTGLTCRSLPESTWRIAVQILLLCLGSRPGTVAAGLGMDTVQHWDVFRDVTEVFILVPALVGLKGNLEMTLASRLSTAAQATVVGFLAAVVAVSLGALSGGKVTAVEAAVLCASSVTTAFISAFSLGLVMVAVILCSRKMGINPDNVATPIAASLGDLVTLAVLAGVSSLFYRHRDMWFLSLGACAFFLALLPAWVVVARRSVSIREVLRSGWGPVILAMSISSIGGLILDQTVSDPNFESMAVFTPVINGVGGNLVAIQASRMSTYLHYWSTPGALPSKMSATCPSLRDTFCSQDTDSRSARVLLLLVVPGQMLFLSTIYLLQGGHAAMTLAFISSYLSAALLQVVVLLYVASVMVRWLWRRGLDPDNFCIPYLTSLGDLLGTGFLALTFRFLVRGAPAGNGA